MIRFTALLLFILSFTAATLCGADFWHKKKFAEWNEGEIRRMLTDSPWAHAYEVMNRTGDRPSIGSAGSGGSRRRGGGGMGAGSYSAESGTTGGGQDSGGASQPPRPAAVLQFRLLSALPVKQAIARVRYGNEAHTSPDAASFLARQETAYILGIAGIPQSLLRGADPASLKNAIQIRIKGKPTAYAEDLRFEKNGPTLTFYVSFSKTGNPIVVEDGEFQVILKLSESEIKRTFKLKDMVFDGKLEL